VRRFDEAREVGRKQLSRTNRAQKSVHRSAGKVFTGNGDQS
jgi:hypothetical protein